MICRLLRFGLIASAVTALLMLGCAGARFPRVMTIGEDDWATEGGGPGRNNEVPERLEPPYMPLWEFDSKAGARAIPLVRDSIVILGNMRGELVLFDMGTGKELGGKSYGLSIEATPALAGYLAFVPVSSEEGIVAIDVKDGSVRWRGSLGPVASSPLIVEDRLFVAALSGKVFCLQRYTGEEVWSYTPQERQLMSIRSSPAYAEGTLIVASDGGRLVALDASTGTERWSFQAGGGIFATPVMTGSLVVAPSLDSSVYAVDRTSGALRWRFDAGSIFYGSAATDSQQIYVGAGNGILYCLSPVSGKVLWTFSAASLITSAPLVAENALAVGSLDRTLYIVDKQNGRALWSYDVPGRIRVSPVLWRGLLIVTSENRAVTVLVPRGTGGQ